MHSIDKSAFSYRPDILMAFGKWMTKGRDRNKKQPIKEQGEQSGHSDSDSQTGMCPRAYGDLINIPSPALETLRLEARRGSLPCGWSSDRTWRTLAWPPGGGGLREGSWWMGSGFMLRSKVLTEHWFVKWLKNNSKSKSGCLWSQVKRLWLTSALNHHRNLCHLCWHGQPGIREASERT